MRSSWSEPYLWVHLAGLAAVPIFLELCLLGLAASQGLPAGLVFVLVAVVGIAPIFWMQWQRPFSIFSLVALALKPSQLTEDQRRILQQFKAPIGKVVAVIAAAVALAALWQLNRWVPLVTLKAAIVPGGVLGGLLLAAVAFLFSNLFLQVPASVVPVLLTSEAQLAATPPYPVTQISRDFTLIGIPVKQILPPVLPTEPAVKSVANPAPIPAVNAPIQTAPEAKEPIQLRESVEETERVEAIQPPQIHSEPATEASLGSALNSSESFSPRSSADSPSDLLADSPSVTSTVVMINFPTSEPEPLAETDFSDLAPPNVSDTIVTVNLPTAETETPEREAG